MKHVHVYENMRMQRDLYIQIYHFHIQSHSQHTKSAHASHSNDVCSLLAHSLVCILLMLRTRVVLSVVRISMTQIHVLYASRLRFFCESTKQMRPQRLSSTFIFTCCIENVKSSNAIVRVALCDRENEEERIICNQMKERT